MKCAICRKRKATHTHHIFYAPEVTIEVCPVRHGLLHRKTRMPQEKSGGVVALSILRAGDAMDTIFLTPATPSSRVSLSSSADSGEQYVSVDNPTSRGASA